MLPDKGFLQVFTGNGKGKTSAALGLALRAAGAGLTVYFLQIMKNFPYSELKSLRRLKDLITIEQIGNDDFVLQKRKPSAAEKKEVVDKLNSIVDLMKKEEYDIFIFDEICVAIYFGLIERELVSKLIQSKPENVEMVFTGRYCPEEIIRQADLVTEMKEVKHYYSTGTLSRRGIDS